MRQYFIQSPRPETDLKRIVDYLLTYVGEIQVKTNTARGAKIIYPEINSPTSLKIKDEQIELLCPPEDNLSLTLIRNLNLRIFNFKLKAFIPADPNILEVTEAPTIISRYQLKPIYRYNHSLVFFALDTNSRVHLINRHLLEYLINHPKTPKTDDFSLIVAKNIGLFIALVDRGLIPLNYYQYSKIINQSGLNLAKAAKRIIVFQLDPTRQTFNQTDRELTKLPKNYLAIKVGPDVGFTTVKGKLKPYLNVSVYLE